MNTESVLILIANLHQQIMNLQQENAELKQALKERQSPEEARQ